MIVWWMAAAVAAPDCSPRPLGARHAWTFAGDGRDVVGEAPGSPTGGAWFDHQGGRSVLVMPREHRTTFEVTGVHLGEAWTVEGTFRAASAHGRVASGPHHLLRLADLDVVVGPGPDPGTLTWTLGEASGTSSGTLGRFTTFQVVHDAGRTCLRTSGEGQPVVCSDGPVVGRASLSLGPPGDATQEELVWDEVTAYARALGPADFPEVPRCEPSPFPVQAWTGPVEETFHLDGNFLVLLGHTTNEEIATEHRLVLAPRVVLSRDTEVRVQIRTLETQWLHRTGSPRIGRPNGTHFTEDIGTSVDLAWLSRAVRNPRFVPFHFAAGRLPRTFGLGISEQHAIGRLDPVPATGSVVYFQEQLRPLGDPPLLLEYDGQAFGSTIDGMQATVGPFTGPDLYTDGVAVTLGRRRPLCAGVVSVVCAEAYRPVYEGAVAASLGSVVNSQPLRPLGNGAGFWVGTDLSARFVWGGWPPAFTARVAAETRSATDGWAWFRSGLEGTLRQAIDAEDAAPELIGGVAGAVAHADLGLALGTGELLVDGEAGVASGALGDGPPAGLHPDYDIDLVGFSQVMARASAEAWAADPTTATPSLGGLYEGAFVRVGPVYRFRASGQWEFPLMLVLSWATADVGDDIVGGRPLGTELDLVPRVAIGDWRFAAGGGVFAPGEAVTAPSREPVWSGEVRLGRNF